MEAIQPTVLTGLDSQRDKSFSYRALDASRRKIRLLKILPPRATQEEEEQGNIRCTIDHMSLDDRPKYKALSCAWGSPKKTIPILVDGSICYVTKNLEVALRHLQTMKIGFLWVDAVCINQKDDAEKSSQVQMMGSIFKEATQVIVWLGPAQDESESAMKLLEKLGSREMDLIIYGQQARRPDDPVWVKGKDTRILAFLDGFEQWPRVTALTHLLKREWWSRLWVVQELLLAKSVVVVCGTYTIPLIALSRGLNLIQEYSLTEAYLASVDLSTAQTSKIFKYSETMINLSLGFDLIGGQGLSLRQALKDTRNRLYCTDARDKVFALVELLSKSEQTKVQIDYSKSAVEVFSLVTMALLQDHGPDILSLREARSMSPMTYLPSWVPDWTCSLRLPMALNHNEGTQFSASGSAQKVCSTISVLPGSKSLSLPGVSFDEISKVGSKRDVMFNSEILGEWLKGFRKLREDMKELLLDKHRYGDPKQLRKVLLRTPFADLSPMMGRIGADDELWLRTLEKLMDEGNEDDLEPWQHRCLAVICGFLAVNDRRIFSSSAGFLGIAPEQAQPGDAVCIFLGGQMPYIIRRLENKRYWLVGEAYVHGVMDGEIMEENPKIVNIELC